MALARYKRIIIHCGIHKTGSSYLQTVFTANRQALCNLSIHYPPYRDPELVKKFGPQHSIIAMGYDDRMSFEENLSGVLDLESECDTLLISGEEFSRACTRPSFFESLLATGAEIVTVFYLRRFDHFIERVYAESVKSHLVGPLTAAQYQLDFSEILRPFHEALGSGGVVVRPYNPRLWPDSSIGQDFFIAIGAAEAWQVIRDHHSPVNKSLSRPETYMLSLTENPAEKARLIERFRTTPFETDDKAVFFRSPEQRRQFNIGHADMNSRLPAMIGVDDLGDFLDLDNFEDDPHWTPFNASTSELIHYLGDFRRRAA